ncbi:MAG: TonB-dependent receptor [Sulfuricurvum sp.]|nr:TonB-dependent receptor [Sulfuricurvum sp.]MDD5386902.1 TonB-dependent receptor [Sulfuricurvum sp.]
MFKHTLSIVACATLVTSLGAKDLTLDPIVVSAAKTEQSLKETTANIDVITAEEIEERHYTSVIEALNTLAGIDFTQSGGIGQQSSLYVRGFSNKYTLVLIDGMRANDPTNFDGAFLDQITLSDIERIEVIKGAQSGIWGADADAGVINIITKKAQPHHVTAYTETGSYGTKKFGATLSHVINKGDIKIGFDRLLTNGFSAAEPKKSNPLYGSRFDNLGWERDQYSSTTVHVKGGINFTDNDRIELAHRNISSHVEFDNTGIDNTTNANSFKQHFNKVSYTHTEAHNILQAYTERSDFERDYYGGYKGKTDETGLIDTFKYTDSGTLVAGILCQKFNVDTVAGSSISKNYTGRALFASNTNLFNNNSTVMTETIRYDDYSIFGSKTTAKIGVKQNISDATVSANYGTAYKVPNLDDIYYPWGNSNENLKPENIRSFDITGTYKNLSLTYFYNTIKDMIAINDLWTQMINISGTSILQGYEAKIKQPIGDSLIVTGAYTRLHAVDGSGKELARRPHESIKASVDWYSSDKLHFGLNSQYIGTRYDTAAQTVETGNYAVFGGVVNYTINKNIDLYAKFDNIFDRYYQTVDGYATAGRSLYAGLKVNY